MIDSFHISQKSLWAYAQFDVSPSGYNEK